MRPKREELDSRQSRDKSRSRYDEWRWGGGHLIFSLTST